MEQEKNLSTFLGKATCKIPMKLPSCNDYINECRKNRYAGAKMKSDVEEQIGIYISRLPRFEKPVKIAFKWTEGNKRRDLDGICFAKKFILDALVKYGVLSDDNRKCVTSFTDSFSYGKETYVEIEIEEV